VGQKDKAIQSGKGWNMRNMARLLACIVLVLAVAWGGLWWYVQERLRDGLVSYAERHNAADGSNTLSYSSIKTGLNPLTASAIMQNVRMTIQPPNTDTQLAASYAQVGLSIDAFNPSVLHVLLPDRLDISTPRGSITITSGSIAGSANLDPRALFNRKIYPLTGGSSSAQDVAVLADGSIEILHIDHINVAETVQDAAGPSQTAMTVQEAIDNIALPNWVISRWQLPFDGRISHVQIGLTASGPLDWSALLQQLNTPQQSIQDRNKMLLQKLHGWASQGGNAKASLQLAIGPTTLNASGNVVFDSDAQPSGTADVTADHLDSFTAALTSAYPPLQQSIAGIEGRYSSYLSTSAASGQILNIHAAYGKDGVLVNGTKQADMPPLDWNALENASVPGTSLPLPQAPGDGSGAASQ
jgi:hypothetical protein